MVDTKGLKIPRWQHCTGSSPSPAPLRNDLCMSDARASSFISTAKVFSFVQTRDRFAGSRICLGLGEFCLLVGLEQDGGPQAAKNSPVDCFLVRGESEVEI